MLKFLTMANSNASDLDNEELLQAGTALAGPNGGLLADLFDVLRQASPNTKVSDLLRTPAATRVLQNVVEGIKSKTPDNSVLVRCPDCGFAFETEVT